MPRTTERPGTEQDRPDVTGAGHEEERHVVEERHVIEEPPRESHTIEPEVHTIVPRWAVIVRRVIYYVLGIVETLLAFRFLLKLFAANPSSPFVAFIYGFTEPLVLPFRGVFPGFATEGAAFEPGTLLAIAVYAVLAWALDRLVLLVASSTSP